MPDAVLKHPDYPLYMSVGFDIANGDVVVNDSHPFAELFKAAQKLSIVIYPSIVWLTPTGNQLIIKELSSPLVV